MISVPTFRDIPLIIRTRFIVEYLQSNSKLFLSSLCMIFSCVKRRCLSFLDAKGSASIKLAYQWYAIIFY